MLPPHSLVGGVVEVVQRDAGTLQHLAVRPVFLIVTIIVNSYGISVPAGISSVTIKSTLVAPL